MADPDPTILENLRDHAIKVNEQFANEMGIPVSAAITCVKPSGTVSQLVDSSSGIHPRFSEYFIRSVRIDKKDPIYEFIKEEGIPVEDEAFHPDSTAVFSFPMASPEGAIVASSTSAISQLELWKKYADHWCEHKPSITVYIKNGEWFDVGGWVYKNFDSVSGISFLPYSDHIYRQAPYQEISKEAYEDLKQKIPAINWDNLKNFEKEDMIQSTKELACTANGCEI